MGQQLSQASWEIHRPLLRTLFLDQDMNLKEIMEKMKEEHKFHASMFQYEDAFRRWGFRKNLKKNEYEYIHHKIKKRKAEDDGKESATYVNGNRVSEKKIKKDNYRRNPPTWANAAVVTAPSPETPPGIMVKTPQTPRTPHTPVTPGGHASSEIFRRSLIRLDNLPSRQFEDLIRSHIILDEQTLQRVLAGQYPKSPQIRYSASPGGQSEPQPGSSNTIIQGPSQGDIWNLAQASLFGNLALHSRQEDNVAAISLAENIHSRLRTLFSETFDGELRSRIDCLLGPLTEESFSEFLMFAGRLASNNKLLENQSDKLFEWVISSQNLPRLRSLCSLKTPATMAFARCMFGSAIRMQNLEAVKSLLKIGINSDHSIKVDSRILTPLMVAVHHSNYELVDALIDAGANVNAFTTDNNGLSSTALHFAMTIPRHQEKIISMLFVAGASANPHLSLPSGRCRSLFEEVIRNHVYRGNHIYPVLDMLLNHGADINAPTCISPHRTALQSAAADGSVELVKFLLDCGADVNAPAAVLRRPGDRSSGGTLFQLAMLSRVHVDKSRIIDGGDEAMDHGRGEGYNCITLARFLMDAGVDINAPAIFDEKLYLQCQGKPGITALQGAALSANFELVQLILNAGGDVNAPACGLGHLGGTALQMAARQPNFEMGLEMVKILLGNGADVNGNSAPSWAYGRTALEEAIITQNFLLVQFLLDYGADCNLPGRIEPPLTLAAMLDEEELSVEMVDILLFAGADVGYGFNRDGIPALTGAAGNGYQDVVDMLLNAGADVNVAVDRTPLKAAIEHGSQELVQVFMDKGAFINSSFDRASGSLSVAVADDNFALVKILLELGVAVNEFFPADDGLGAHWVSNALPLAVRCRGGNLSILRMMIEAGADVDGAVIEENDYSHPNFDVLGCTALLKAARFGNIEATHILLRAGASVNARPRPFGGWTALQAAAEKGDKLLVEVLLAAGADINADAHPDGGRTALQAAVARGHSELVEIFLQRGADVNAMAAESKGMTSLQAAAFHGHLQIAISLLKANADPNAPAAKFDGLTAIESAAQNGRLDIFQLLLNARADVGGLVLDKAKELAFKNAQGAMVTFIDEMPGMRI